MFQSDPKIHLNENGKDTEDIGDPMAEDGHSSGSTVVNVEDLRHDQSYLPGGCGLAFYVHLLVLVEDQSGGSREVGGSNLNTVD